MYIRIYIYILIFMYLYIFIFIYHWGCFKDMFDIVSQICNGNSITLRMHLQVVSHYHLHCCKNLCGAFFNVVLRCIQWWDYLHYYPPMFSIWLPYPFICNTWVLYCTRCIVLWVLIPFLVGEPTWRNLTKEACYHLTLDIVHQNIMYLDMYICLYIYISHMLHVWNIYLHLP